jgi:hypothetical protein
MASSTDEAAEQAQRAWQRSLDVVTRTQTIILEIKQMCERTQVSIATSRMILGKQVNPANYCGSVGEEKPANFRKDPVKTGKR